MQTFFSKQINHLTNPLPDNLPPAVKAKIFKLRTQYFELALDVADIAPYESLSHKEIDIGRAIRAIDFLKSSCFAAEEALLFHYYK